LTADMDFTSSLRDERDDYPASNPPDKSGSLWNSVGNRAFDVAT